MNRAASVWPIVRLGEIISHRKEFIQIDDVQKYKRCRVQLHAKGIVLRDEVEGSIIKTKKQQVCRAGELLVAEIDAKVGGFGIVPPNLDGAIVSSHYFLYTLSPEKVDAAFLGYFVRTPLFRDQVQAQGSTNYAAIKASQVLDYQIPLPPLSEQNSIVSKIERLAAKIEEAGAIKCNLIQETDVLLKSTARSLLSEIETEITPLKNWTDPARNGIQTGPFGAQLGRSDFCEKGTPLLTIGNIQYNGLKTEQLIYVSDEKAAFLSRYAVKEGDILFARMGTVGRCCVAPLEADGWLINYHIIRLALEQKKVEPRFIHWTIAASTEVENYLAKTTRGATRAGVNTKILSGLPCKVPPLQKQKEIVEYLDSLQSRVDGLRTLQAKTTAELDALLPSVLDKAFKGEL